MIRGRQSQHAHHTADRSCSAIECACCATPVASVMSSLIELPGCQLDALSTGNVAMHISCLNLACNNLSSICNCCWSRRQAVARDSPEMHQLLGIDASKGDRCLGVLVVGQADYLDKGCLVKR